MAEIRPFRGLRPPAEIVEELAVLPYDVMNSKEAALFAEGKRRSLLRITRAEIELPGVEDIHTEVVYNRAFENFRSFRRQGWLKEDEISSYYIYAQTMAGRTQYGIVGCAACDDYLSGVIKKHELTRPEKEDDRMMLSRYLNANIEPVFFTYRAVPEIDAIVTDVVANKKPVYDFVADDGFGHHFWVIDDKEIIDNLLTLFATKVPHTYVADGHHRTAAAARLGAELKRANPNHTGEEEYNFFMAVHFPDDQLQIIDYNRLITDLGSFTDDSFLDALNRSFTVIPMDEEQFKPTALHELSLYLSGRWYKLTAKPETYDDNDPIGSLDVTILSEQVLEPLLGIKDLRTSERIDFVGGIRGLDELKKRVDSGEMRAAFALYPVSMNQLINVADSGNIMPPKTTWFEPKLRSGLVIHTLD